MQFSGGWKWPTIKILLFLTIPFIAMLIYFACSKGVTYTWFSVFFSGMGTILLGSSISPAGLVPPQRPILKWILESLKYRVPVSYNILLFSIGIIFLLIGLIIGYLAN